MNNTDTSDESDVDIRVEYFTDGGQDPDIARIFFTKRAGLAKSLTREQLGLIDAPLPLNQETFKTHIERALVERFGSSNVHRNDKCIKVDESSLIFPADIVPCFPIRLYEDVDDFEPGVSIRCDSGEEILNYPEQHYKNGVEKTESTGRRFKKMVRCFKRMENYLVRTNSSLVPLPSFFMECLVYNCPDELFMMESYHETFRDLMLRLYFMLDDTPVCNGMMEVNGVKTLFKDGQSWSPEEAKVMALLAWGQVK